MSKVDWWRYPSQLIKHFHMSPKDAWSMTLKEFINLMDCDSPQYDIPAEVMTKEAMEEFKMRFEENRAKRLAKNG